MKYIVEVDEDKTAFFQELMRQLQFVRFKPLSPYSSEILEGLKDSVEEVNLVKEGKAELKSARDLLNEL